MIRENEEDERRIDNLTDYARRIHSGLILNGDIVQQETPNTLALISYVGRAERRKLLSQKELRRHEINRRTISWSSGDDTSSQPSSSFHRRTIVKKV